MKILQINSCAVWGSTGRIADEIGEKVIAQGWESWIAYGRYANESRSQLIKIGSKADIIRHGITSRLLDNHGEGSVGATKRFLKQVDRLKPDLIHLHNIHGYYINYPLLFDYIAQKEIPVVWTMHDCWALTGHCAHFATIGCDKWKTGCHNCEQLNTYPKSLFIDHSAKNWTKKKEYFNKPSNLTIVAISKWIEEMISNSFVNNANIVRIPNGIDTTLFKKTDSNLRECYGLTGKTILLAVASKWDNNKGLNDYFELSRKLSQDTTIVLVGQMPDNLRLPPNIIAPGRTNELFQLAQWYTTADIVMNLSHAESFGLTTIEGMACGTPAIVYNCTANPELISESTGIVVEKGDIEGLKTAIERLANNPDKTAIEKACIERAALNFDKNTHFDEYINLYKQILNNHKSK